MADPCELYSCIEDQLACQSATHVLYSRSDTTQKVLEVCGEHRSSEVNMLPHSGSSRLSHPRPVGAE